MGYMGFGMRKEVYNRKPKEAFAHRKTLLRDTDAVLKDAEIATHETPIESILMPITRSEKVGRIVRKVLLVFFLIIMTAIVAIYFAQN